MLPDESNTENSTVWVGGILEWPPGDDTVRRTSIYPFSVTEGKAVTEP